MHAETSFLDHAVRTLGTELEELLNYVFNLTSQFESYSNFFYT